MNYHTSTMDPEPYNRRYGKARMVWSRIETANRIRKAQAGGIIINSPRFSPISAEVPR